MYEYYHEYPLMSKEQIKKYIPMINKYKVSQKAMTSGFMKNYLENGPEILTQPSDQKDLSWGQKRYLFIRRVLLPYNRKPTYRRFLSLIAWGYLPSRIFTI